MYPVAYGTAVAQSYKESVNEINDEEAWRCSDASDEKTWSCEQDKRRMQTPRKLSTYLRVQSDQLYAAWT